MPTISVITPTHQRPSHLWKLIECLNRQDCEGILIEHLIIPDGPDNGPSAMVAEKAPCHEGIRRRYLPQSTHRGHCGAACKDVGLQEASGDYVAFWDDDNWFYEWALSTLLKEVIGSQVPISVAQMRNDGYDYEPVPDVERLALEGGVFHEGNIDSGCFLVQTDLARRGHWFDQQGYGTDYRYFTRLIERVGVEAVRFVPTVIGVHL